VRGAATKAGTAGRWRLSSMLVAICRCGAPRPGRRRSAGRRRAWRTSSGPSAKREVVADAGAAVHLHRPVDHLAGHVRRHHLDHRDLLLGVLVADLVHHPGGVERQQARLVDHACARRRCARASRPGRPAACRRPRASRRACTSARARARPGRSGACSGGCGPGRGGPGRSRSRGPRRAGCWRPARARCRSDLACGRAARRRSRTPAAGAPPSRPACRIGTRIIDCCGGAARRGRSCP
jgi:hypothetical protein